MLMLCLILSKMLNYITENDMWPAVDIKIICLACVQFESQTLGLNLHN
jgi:hypothetical protein